MPTRPHLLFVTTDHQRHDSLGKRIGGQSVTPRLDALRERSVAFTRAYTACPLCVPARTSLATGLLPCHTGVNTNIGFAQGAAAPSLHEELAEAGYRLYHAGMQHIQLRPSFRERVPFAFYSDARDHQQHCADAGIDLKRTMAGPGLTCQVPELVDGKTVPRPYSDIGTATWPHENRLFKDIFQRDVLLEALADAPDPLDAPLAVFFNIWAPHPPLVVGEPWRSKFDPADIELPPRHGLPAQDEPSDRRSGPPARLAHNVSESQWRETIALHYGLVSLADELIGSLLDFFASRGWLDNALVVFTSDHGDHLGEHAMYQKMECYDQAARVPLLLAHPNLTPATVDTPVSHLDLKPTLQRLLDLPARHRDLPHDGEPIWTESLAQPTTVDRPNLPSDRIVFMEYHGNAGQGLQRWAAVSAIDKLILDGNGELEYFDLLQDPHEARNQAKNPALAPRISSLRRRIETRFSLASDSHQRV